LALLQGDSIREQLEKLSPQVSPPTTDAIESFRKKLSALLGAPGGFLAPPAEELTLSRVTGETGTLYRQVWQADAQPTSSQMEGLSLTERDSADVLKRWQDLKNSDLPALNHLLRESKVPEIVLESEPHQELQEDDEE